MHLFDNAIFNVNGDMRDKDRLAAVLRIAVTRVVGYRKSTTHGLVLYCAESPKCVLFPNPLTADELLPLVLAYLASDDAKKVECKNWDANADHDGDTRPGWRVYCEDWGHVDREHQAIVAIKPAYVWFGK